MTEDQKTALELRESGVSREEIAWRMGKSVKAVKGLLERARAWKDADPSARSAAVAVGAGVVPHSYWAKVDGVSAYFKTEPQENEVVSLVETVAGAFRDIPAYVPREVEFEHSDLMTVYPLYDLHAGMLAWGRETRSQDYDLDLFKSDLIRSVERLASRVPDSGHALVILGGDTIHVDDHSNMTPGSGHILDADGRFEKIVDVAIEAITHAIEALAEKHARVSVVVLTGNHDRGSHLILKAALKQRYRSSDRIQFPVVSGADKSDMFWLAHGKSLIVAHHGDKMKPETLCMIAADQCPSWSQTRHRVVLTGHLHSLKVRDMPGITHYTLRAFAPADQYGASFGGVRGIQAMTFCDKHGLIGTVHDSVWRDE